MRQNNSNITPNICLNTLLDVWHCLQHMLQCLYVFVRACVCVCACVCAGQVSRWNWNYLGIFCVFWGFFFVFVLVAFLCFSAFLGFCASLLFCFSASLLFCFSASFASLLVYFSDCLLRFSLL